MSTTDAFVFCCWPCSLFNLEMSGLLSSFVNLSPGDSPGASMPSWSEIHDHPESYLFGCASALTCLFLTFSSFQVHFLYFHLKANWELESKTFFLSIFRYVSQAYAEKEVQGGEWQLKFQIIWDFDQFVPLNNTLRTGTTTTVVDLKNVFQLFYNFNLLGEREGSREKKKERKREREREREGSRERERESSCSTPKHLKHRCYSFTVRCGDPEGAAPLVFGASTCSVRFFSLNRRSWFSTHLRKPANGNPALKVLRWRFSIRIPKLLSSALNSFCHWDMLCSSNETGSSEWIANCPH